MYRSTKSVSKTFAVSMISAIIALQALLIIVRANYNEQCQSLAGSDQIVGLFGEDVCFVLVKRLLTFPQAQSQCAHLHPDLTGVLAVLHNQDRQRFIQSLAADHVHPGIQLWFSLLFDRTRGVWFWSRAGCRPFYLKMQRFETNWLQQSVATKNYAICELRLSGRTPVCPGHGHPDVDTDLVDRCTAIEQSYEGVSVFRTGAGCLVYGNTTSTYEEAVHICQYEFNGHLAYPDSREKLIAMAVSGKSLGQRYFWVALRRQASISQWYFDVPGCLRQYLNWSDTFAYETFEGDHIVLDGGIRKPSFLRRVNDQEQHRHICEVRDSPLTCENVPSICKQFESDVAQVTFSDNSCLVLVWRHVAHARAVHFCEHNYTDHVSYLSPLESPSKRRSIQSLLQTNPAYDSQVWTNLRQRNGQGHPRNKTYPLNEWSHSDQCGRFRRMSPFEMKTNLDVIDLGEEPSLDLTLTRTGKYRPSAQAHRFVCEIPVDLSQCPHKPSQKPEIPAALPAAVAVAEEPKIERKSINPEGITSEKDSILTKNAETTGLELNQDGTLSATQKRAIDVQVTVTISSKGQRSNFSYCHLQFLGIFMVFARI